MPLKHTAEVKHTGKYEKCKSHYKNTKYRDLIMTKSIYCQKKKKKQKDELNYYYGGNSFCLLTLQRMQGRQCSLFRETYAIQSAKTKYCYKLYNKA